MLSLLKKIGGIGMVMLLFFGHLSVVPEVSAAPVYQQFFDRFGDGTETDKNLNKYPEVYKTISGGNLSTSNYPPELLVRNAILYGLDIFVWIVTALAVLFIILAGIKMVTDANGEEAVKKQITVIKDIAIGMVVMHSAKFFVANIYSDPAGEQVNLVGRSDLIVNFKDATTPILVAEKVVYPLLNYFFGFVASLAILFIILSTFRIITSRGNDDKIKSAREGLINTALGLFVMLLAQYFVKAAYGLPTSSNRKIGPDVNYGIELLMNIANYLLGFMSFIAVIMLIYAGALIVTSGVRAENKKKGVGIAKNVMIGLILTVSVYAVVSTIVRLSV